MPTYHHDLLGGPDKWVCLPWSHWGAADYFTASIRLSGAVTVPFTLMPPTSKFFIIAFPVSLYLSRCFSDGQVFS